MPRKGLIRQTRSPHQRATAVTDSRPHVLYISHTGVVGGGEMALMDHIRVMPTEVRTAAVMCPSGELADVLRARGVTVIPFRGTVASFRVQVREVARAMVDTASSVRTIRRTARSTDVTVIHANSIRAGLLALLAGMAGGPPVVVHVHDVLPDGVLARLVRGVVLRRASALIAVSQFARSAFLEGFPHTHLPFEVMLNPIDAQRVLSGAPTRSDARRKLGFTANALLLGVVGQITPWKGQHTAIRAVARALPTYPQLRLLLVGEPRFVAHSTRYANQAYLANLHELVDSLGVAHAVEFLGHRRDVPTIMRALDLLLLPSWTEPLSRAMLEAMILGTPVLATNRGGPADIINDGETGYLATPRDDELWARRIAAILADADGRASVARRASHDIQQLLDLERYVTQAMAVYERVER